MCSMAYPVVPSRDWGRDRLLCGHPKLFIADLVRIPGSNEHPEKIFLYRNHPIFTVDVMGVITKVDERNRVVIYTIDDGTGSIPCTFFKNTDQHDALEAVGDEIPKGPLRQKYERILEEKDQLSECFEHGQLLHVWGVLQVYQGIRCVKVYHCIVARQSMAEVHRIHEQLDLYEKFYDKPLVFQLKRFGVNNPNPEIFCADAIRQLILDEICNQQLESFTKTQILELFEKKTERVKQDPVYLHQALQGLQRTGHLYRCQREAEYRVSQYCKQFQRSILELIATNQNNINGTTFGCCFSKIFNDIRKLRQFSEINSYGMWICLRQLERQSDVVFYADDQFVAVS